MVHGMLVKMKQHPVAGVSDSDDETEMRLLCCSRFMQRGVDAPL